MKYIFFSLAGHKSAPQNFLLEFMVNVIFSDVIKSFCLNLLRLIYVSSGFSLSFPCLSLLTCFCGFTSCSHILILWTLDYSGSSVKLYVILFRVHYQSHLDKIFYQEISRVIIKMM